MSPRGKRLATVVSVLASLAACHSPPEFAYAKGGVGLCTLSLNAGALVYGQVQGWGSSYVDNGGLPRTPVQVKVNKVIRGSVATGVSTLKMFGTFDPASGRLATQGVPSEDTTLKRDGKNTEGYLFLGKHDLSAVEGSGYLWLEPDGLYHSGSTRDDLVDGVSAQTILDADKTYAGKTSCPAPAPASAGPDGGTAAAADGGA